MGGGNRVAKRRKFVGEINILIKKERFKLVWMLLGRVVGVGM